jgi:2-polyprenyl-6-methoxyphenol hydroxylase-like FAD-dependent oxidoreductase
MLIGADGIGSTVRRLLLPDGPAPAFTGLVGSGGFVPRSAMERIVGADRARSITLSFGSGVFIGHAFADRSDERGAYWWYALPRDRPLARDAREVPDVETLLALGDWSDTTRRILHSTSRMFPTLNLFDVARLPRWSEGRVGLIGDAAHAVSPHSGQGASMALEDAFALVEALRAAPDSPAHALEAFERARRARVEKVVQMGRRSGDQKRKGPIGTAIMTALMPIMLRLMPRPTWLYGWEAR